MEILFVSHKYPPSTGGMEKQSFELINGMSRLCKVHSIVYDGVEGRLSFFLQMGNRIREMIKTNPGISIIHFNDGLPAVISLIFYRQRHLKRTVTLHGLDVVFPGFLYQKLIFPGLKHFDLIFAVSRATASACEERGIPIDKIAVIPNGVEARVVNTTGRSLVAERLSKKYQVDIAGKKVLVALGRPVKRKGFSWFIKQVLPLLKGDVVLLLIGPVQDPKHAGSRLLNFMPAFIRQRITLFLGAPGDETELRKLLKAPEVRRRVARLGRLPEQEIDDILGIADAFIMPNIEVEGDMEGFGLVCLEACIRGARVFAAASGGITDAIVPGRNGTLLPPGHVASWVYALNQFMEKPDTELDPGSIMAFTSGRFSWEKMTESYFRHFKALVNQDSDGRSKKPSAASSLIPSAPAPV